jgi:hypothetical protein
MVGDSSERLHMDRRDVRFTRREVRERTQWSDTQLRIHLERLVEMEYVIAYRGKQGQSYGYGLAYNGEGKDGTPFLAGLVDADALDAEHAVPTSTIPTSRGSEGHFAGGSRVGRGPVAGGSRTAATITSHGDSLGERMLDVADVPNTHPGTRVNGTSYVHESSRAD